jgi:hypothetical protein
MNGGRKEIRKLRSLPFDKLRANGLTQCFLKRVTKGVGVELFRESALTLVPDSKDVHPVLFRQETIQRDIAGSSF